MIQPLRRRFSAPGLLFVARIAGAALGLVTQVLLARSMPADSLGLFFFAMSASAVLAVVAAAGYPQASMRFLTRYRAFARGARYAGFIRFAGRDIAGLSGALAAALVLGAWLLADAETARTLTLAALAIPALAIGQLLGAIAIADRKFLLASLPDFLITPVGLLLVVGVMTGLGTTPAPETLLLAAVCLYAANTLLKRIGLRRSRLLPDRAAKRVDPPARLWRGTSYPLLMLALFTALFADVALLLASPFVARAELAVFAICLKISFLAAFAMQAVHQTALPAIAEDLHRGRAREAMARASESNRANVAVALVATILALLFGERVLAIFGPAFAEASTALTILMGALVVRALAGPASQMLTVLGRQWIVLAACPAALGVLAAANAALIPGFGLTGAAIAVFLSMSLWSAALAVALARTTGVRSHVEFRLRLGVRSGF